VGALLDESHTVDIARWFFGEVASVFAFTGRVSSLEITADDLAEMVLRFDSGAVVSVHMDIYGRSHRKEMLIQGEDGNLDWDFYANRVTLYRAGGKSTEEWDFDTDRNEMFLAEARHFLECVEGTAVPPVDGADGLETLKVLLAARESSDTGRVVELGSGA
jgi:predicted dehydrogenase